MMEHFHPRFHVRGIESGVLKVPHGVFDEEPRRPRSIHRLEDIVQLLHSLCRAVACELVRLKGFHGRCQPLVHRDVVDLAVILH